MPAGNPQGYAPAPAQGGMPDPNQLLEMLMQLLTTPPEQPAGDITAGLPPSGAPQSAREMSPEDQMMSQILQMVQMTQMQQSGQQSANAVQGAAGGMFGSMGGRPPGS